MTPEARLVAEMIDGMQLREGIAPWRAVAIATRAVDKAGLPGTTVADALNYLEEQDRP